jgi:Lon protease-like protein
MSELALFPLKTVLLPGNRLPLKIFEPRYSDMIAHCMREDENFGIVLIHQGEETDPDVEIFSIGTSAKVIDWQHRNDGLLGITALGLERFQIDSVRHSDDGLLIAEVEYLHEQAADKVPDQYYYMSELLQHIMPNKDADILSLGFTATVYQLIYVLPLDNALKQQLLEVPSTQDRAIALHAELIRLGVIQYVKPGL